MSKGSRSTWGSSDPSGAVQHPDQGEEQEMGGEAQGCHQAGVWWVVRAGVQAVQLCAERQHPLKKLDHPQVLWSNNLSIETAEKLI